MTSTLYRRLKVDNGIKIWHYSGVMIHQTEVKEMYQVAWRPGKAELWPDRTGQSPRPAGTVSNVPAPGMSLLSACLMRNSEGRGCVSPSWCKRRYRISYACM